MMVEVHRGQLTVKGVVVPLRKGLILLALAKAGWRGTDGTLTEDFVRVLFRADPRIQVTVEGRTRTGTRGGWNRYG